MHTALRIRLAAVGATLFAAVQICTAAEGGAEPNIFAGSIGNALITLIIFAVVVTVLGRFFWQPVLNVLQERERTIRESIESARADRAEAEKLLGDYRAQLERAQSDAAALVEQGRKDAEAARQRMLGEARTEAEELTTRARREIQGATDAAIAELYERTAELSVQVAGRILKRELSAEDHRRLIDESIETIRSQGKGELN